MNEQLPENLDSQSVTHEFEFQPPPRTPEETGLQQNLLLDLTTKIMHAGGTMTPVEISQVIKLPRLVVRALIKEMTSLTLVESLGLESADIKSEIRYTLTDKGIVRALNALKSSRYLGPAPVPLAAFNRQVRLQSIRHEEVHRPELEAAMSHLIFPSDIFAQVGPAANSARSVLLYGEAGNGKTSIAQALGSAFSDRIYLPYSIAIGNQIIQYFDDTLHEVDPLPEGRERDLDPRWLRCRRPYVITGGELTVDMLDLSYDPMAGFYEAPMHLKALGGVFVLDDFGRQREEPRQFLDRWIVPLDKGFDILALHNGHKFQVPFDQLVVFSTNLQPEKLGDTAGLRRIYFKVYVPSPTKADYLKIFQNACEETEIGYREDVLSDFFDAKYRDQNLAASGSHPQFLLEHIKSACKYHNWQPELSQRLLDLAWRNVAADRAQSN